MRLPAWACSLACIGIGALSGCAQNAAQLASQNQTLQQTQLAAQQRLQELQSRASTLDHDNQELESLLAQTRQHGKLLEDQLTAVKEQLAGATSQLAQIREEKQLTERQAETLLASTKRRGGATITANSSLDKNVPSFGIPGIEARVDGDVVRVELPAMLVFQPNTASLLPTAGALVDQVASELARAYPQQIIGVEGHTDADPLPGTPGVSNHQLSVNRSMAIYEYLVTKNKIASVQLFAVGHGGNHPVVSNATPTGKQRNNRVELVIYPETAAGR